MAKYRVITNRYGGFFAQKKGWLFWHTLCHPTEMVSDGGGGYVSPRLNFDSSEGAVSFILETRERLAREAEEAMREKEKKKAGGVVVALYDFKDER